MHGLMMHDKLLVSNLIDHAARYHGDAEVVSVSSDGTLSRHTYGEILPRSKRLTSAFAKRGLKHSDRIATLAWNNIRHFELYYAISGGGYVCHTVNPRLFADQMIYIINHAEDKLLFFDKTFMALVGPLREKLNVETYVLMEPRDDAIAADHPWIEFYEEFVAEGSDDDWPDDVDELDASSLCYTSGTTGNPKGVLYSHRTTVLHAMASVAPDVMNLSARETILPVVPMFHVNAWGLTYACPMVGAKLILPGPGLDGASLTKLLVDEKVTMAAGVPTIWKGLLDHLDATQTKLPDLKNTIIGGSACPPSMIEKFRNDYGVDVLHAWGMTELSPLGSVNNLKSKHLALPEADQIALRVSQGRPPYGIELGIFDEDGKQLPNDGTSQGELYCRGLWVISDYFHNQEGSPLRDGWFPTGDVATLDQDGYMVIRDRSKDVIKSGGEWISSVELENLAVAHPDVADAAVIAATHSKWDERPLLIVIPKEGAKCDEQELLAYYTDKVAKWWIPDAVKVVDEIPRNATGKIWKTVLRERYGNELIDRGM